MSSKFSSAVATMGIDIREELVSSHRSPRKAASSINWGIFKRNFWENYSGINRHRTHC